MSGLHYPRPHHGSAAEFQISSWPYLYNYATVSNTVQKLKLPYVSRHFTIINNGTHPVRVGITENGVLAAENPNYFVIEGGKESPRLEIKTDTLFFVRHENSNNATNVSVIVGMTSVKNRDFLLLSGSEGFEGIG
mgnify:FL=1